MKLLQYKFSMVGKIVKFALLIASLFLTNINGVFANILNVPADYLSIQDAINAADESDEIIVASGVYYENIYFRGKNITLRSSAPLNIEVVESVIVNGNSLGSAITLTGSENASCVISGLTITNGKSEFGGGINGNNSLATIKNSIITKNSASSGGGIYSCQGNIYNNVISFNTASSGGGFNLCNGVIKHNSVFKNQGGNSIGVGGAFAFCDGVINGNKVFENYGGLTGGQGAGFYHCNALIQNNAIYKNGGIIVNGVFFECNGYFQNNTIVSNKSAIFQQCKPAIVLNCILGDASISSFSALNLAYCCVISNYPLNFGLNIIYEDPQFIDAEGGNYHLESSSPCIDKGSASWLVGDSINDFDGENRFVGNNVDIGCDEYNSYPDFDGDFLSDSDESAYGSDPNNTDSDGDGLKDGLEVFRGTNPVIFNQPVGISVPDQINSVEKAIMLAFNHEIITVNPGVYYENLFLNGKDIILQGSNLLDDKIISETALNGRGQYAVITLKGTESANCVIRGLKIENGKSRFGSAIAGNGASVTIEKNIVSKNIGFVVGHIISKCDGLISKNVIEKNVSESGSCAALGYCDGQIVNNLISDNIGTNASGGIAYCDAWIKNNIICHNSGSPGGGIMWCNGVIENNVIYKNSGGSGWSAGGLIGCLGSIKNCIVWENEASGEAQIDDFTSTPTYSCIQYWNKGGEGNISLDPLFINAEKGNFYLSEDSPCIDAGSPEPQYNDKCIPPGMMTERNDMGRFGGANNCDDEITGFDVKNHLLGFKIIPSNRLFLADFNKDGKLDISDVAACFKH